MSSLSPETLLESVVRITMQRTEDSLEISLVSTMLGLLDVDEISLLKVPEGHYPEHVEEVLRATQDDRPDEDQDSTGAHHFIDKDEQIRRCLDTAEIVSTGGPPFRLLYPIVVNYRVVGVVDFRCGRCPETDQRLINGFLRIYQNYLAILDESEHDTLTGLLNRRTFDGRINRILDVQDQERKVLPKPSQERREEDQPVANHWLGILDIDHFKRINDTYGHLYGDEVLLLLAQIMRKSFRAHDLLFRYGGEEFVIVLAPTDMENALAVFDRFRDSVASYDFPQVGTVTVSIGVVRIDSQDLPSSVVGRADQALYYAKSNGRNQVCSYENLRDKGLLGGATALDDIELF